MLCNSVSLRWTLSTAPPEYDSTPHPFLSFYIINTIHPIHPNVADHQSAFSIAPWSKLPDRSPPQSHGILSFSIWCK
jgi:hypothetical protein